MGIWRGRKSGKKERPLEVMFKGLAEQKLSLWVYGGGQVPRVAVQFEL